MAYQFDIVLPWDKDRLRDDSRLRWPISFLRDRNILSSTSVIPPKKTIERVRFLTEQLCAKRRRWVVCFGDNTQYTNKLFHYVVASFVLTSGLSAEISSPKKFIEFAFNFRDDAQFGCTVHSFQVCGLLAIPYFDPMYPGYQKARPRIAELLSERKLNKKPCMIEVFVPQNLPTDFENLAKYTPSLVDIVGNQAQDLFGGNQVKFVTIEVGKERL